MRTFKKTLKVVFVVLFVVLTVILFKSIDSWMNKQKTNNTTENAKTQVDISKSELKKEGLNAEKFITSISSETEIILLSENGKTAISHDKNPQYGGIENWLFNSEVRFIVDYSAVLSIPTKEIVISEEGDRVIVKYSSNDIHVKAININEITPLTETGIIGKKYTPFEIAALTEISIDMIRSSTESEEATIFAAGQNLEYYIRNTALKFAIFNVDIEETGDIY